MKILWIKDNKAGHLNKVRGVLRAMRTFCQIDLIEYEVSWKVPGLRWLYGRLETWGIGCAAGKVLKGLPDTAGVDLILSAGGATQWANVALAKQLGVPNVFLGSLRGMNSESFSLVASHDAPENKGRFFRFDLIPSAYTPDTYAKEAQDVNPSGKIVWGLLIGGDGEGYRWTESDYLNMCEELLRQAKVAGAEVWIATSRRTPRSVELKIAGMIGNSGIEFSNSYTHQKNEKTKSLGVMMATCSMLCVTADSMSMVHEAVSTGTPVMILRPNNMEGKKRVMKNHRELADRRMVMIQSLCDMDIQNTCPEGGWDLIKHDPSLAIAKKIAEVTGL